MVDKLDLILQGIEWLKTAWASTFILLVMCMTFSLAYLRGFKNTHLLENLNKAKYQAKVRLERTLHKMVPNLGGAETKPDALPILEQAVAKHWLDTMPRIMEFTEKVWKQIIKDKLGSFNRGDWVALMARWKAYRIVKQQIEGATAGKGRALIAAQTSEGMRRKMEAIMRQEKTE